MSTSISFESFHIPHDVDLLFRDGEVVPLEPLAVRALRYLAENGDRVVSKEELLEKVWPDVFTTDLVLKRAVSLARRALGDDPKTPRFICTYHGRGYQFVAPVTRVGHAGPVARGGDRADEPRASLPERLTSFVGREQAIARIWHLLGDTRLVTVVGPGGVGKSRLAVEVAYRYVEDFPDGIRYVDLAAVRDPDLVAPTVARAFGLEAGSEQHALRALAERVRDTRALLLLDTCDRVPDACARVATTLLAHCARLWILTTSREILRVSGEVVFHVVPLSVPPMSQVPAEYLTAFDSVRLFLDRARTYRPDFALHPDNAAAVARICRELEGLPLAVELAAAQTRLLTTRQVEALLADPLRSLRAASRGTPERHHTLWAAVDWSHDALDERERVLFRRLSAFRGGFSLEAAEAVSGAEDDPIELLARFADKSLLVVDVEGPEARFRMLEVVRRYAEEKLREAGERLEMASRLRRWLLGFARDCETGIEGPEQAEWLARMDAEIENLRAWTDDAGDAPGDHEVVLEICASTVRYFDMRGHWREARRRLDTALALSGDARPLVRAKALRGAALLASRAGEIARAVALCGESLELSRAHGDGDGSVCALSLLGTLRAAAGSYDDGRQICEEARTLAVALGGRRVGFVERALARIAHGSGDLPEAIGRYSTAIAAFRSAGNEWDAADALCGLARATSESGDGARAAALFDEVVALARGIGQTSALASGLARRAAMLVDEDDVAAAAMLFAESLEALRDFDDPEATAAALECVAFAASRRGLHHTAVCLAGAADTTGAAMERPVAEAARREAWPGVSQSALGTEGAEEVYRQGAALTREAALGRARDTIVSWTRPENVATAPSKRRRD